MKTTSQEDNLPPTDTKKHLQEDDYAKTATQDTKMNSKRKMKQENFINL